jgi:hypothetical protein
MSRVVHDTMILVDICSDEGSKNDHPDLSG